MTSRDVIVYEKLPEHDDDPIVTSAQSEGVTQDKSALSEGFTKAPAVADIPPMPVTEPANPTTMPTVSSPLPPVLPLGSPTVPPPIIAQPRRSERTVRPTWVKAASEAEKAHDTQTKVANKAIRDARAEH